MPPPTLPPPRDAGVPGSPPPPGRPATAAAPAARPLQSEGRKARVTVETGDPGRCGRAPAAGRGPGQSWKTVSRRRSDRGRVPRGTAALSELRADLRCRRGSAGARATPASNRTCAPQGGGRGRGRGRPGAGLGVRRLGFWSWPCAPLSGNSVGQKQNACPQRRAADGRLAAASTFGFCASAHSPSCPRMEASSFLGCSGADVEFGGLMAQASDPSFWPSEKTAWTEYGQEGTETGRSQYLFPTCP
ncbi:WAS/WASL-interacting protein family member 3-like isoform X1 [Mustela erminea]|uniref:WAS/WASL-interacting protein family member 3-like isoform X1 n=1 Tax=Mustela erminea TaxID=36723 RepID=UPI001386809A|nr:WAS/WASL-interacting protein family member 3-like isoform X1 [Mustela erminea]